MTIVLSETQAPPRRMTADEVDEVCALTLRLPQLLTGWATPAPIGLADAAMRLDAALWDVACRAGVDLRPDDTVFDVVDALAARGWAAGVPRDALRAFVMLRWAPRTVHAELLACRAAGRLIAYLELRARYG